MPELPEVETVVADLRPLLTGRVLGSLAYTGLDLRRPWCADWQPLLTGRTVLGLRRRGKWIVVDLDNGSRLQVHLGMTGQFTVQPVTQPPAAHTHLTIALDNGTDLRYCDIRRFGSVVYYPDEAALQQFFQTQGLGPEPFDLEPVAWWRSLRASHRVLKAILLDQSVVAGVGNIYADESLFVAGLRPTRRGDGLSQPRAERLREAIVSVLTEAIAQRGSTIRNYVGGSGLEGGYQDEFRVYGRTGQPCRGCGEAIAVRRLAGRSTHYCRRCQK